MHGRLSIEWNRIMHGRGYTCCFEVLLYLVTRLDLHGVLSPSAMVVIFNKRGGYTSGTQQTGITPSNLLTQLQLARKDIQLGQQDGCLQGVKTAVNANADVVIAAILPMTSDLPHYLGQRVIVSENRPAIAIATDGFAREKAGACSSRQVAGALAPVGSADSLRGIFGHRDTVPGSKDIDRIEVGTLAIQRNRDD